MLTFFDFLLDSIAPHQCLGCGGDGSLLCPACVSLLPDALPVCYRCRAHSLGGRTCVRCRRNSPLRSVMTATNYEGIGQELVRRLKFERALAAAHPMSSAMTGLCTFSDGVILVPVPTARARVRQRGYDQAEIIAQRLGCETGLTMCRYLRRLGSQRQTGSSRTERLRQLSGAFEVLPGLNITPNTPLVLVDDVMTTGATLEVAAYALKSAGVREIHGITFARA